MTMSLFSRQQPIVSQDLLDPVSPGFWNVKELSAVDEFKSHRKMNFSTCRKFVNTRCIVGSAGQ
jgi:hypothetical protein